LQTRVLAARSREVDMSRTLYGALLTSLCVVLAATSSRASEPIAREGRVALETLGGLGGAAVGAAVGFGLAYAIIGDEGDFSGLAAAVVGGIPGAAIGLTTGIYAVGELAGGDGNYWATWAGVLAGAVVPTIVTATLAGNGDSDGALIALWVLLPTAGGVIGYELSQADRAAPAPSTRLFVMPTDGGVFAGLSGPLP
jgi:hypothetical protein